MVVLSRCITHHPIWRRAMVVNSDLPYPEGRAAAEILKSVEPAIGEQGPPQSQDSV